MTRIPAGKMEYHSLPAFYLNTIHFTDFQSYKTIHHLPTYINATISISSKKMPNLGFNKKKLIFACVNN